MERRTVVRALRAIRRRKRWSQRQLSQKLDISQSEMSRWERAGLEECSVAEVERWATALNAHLALELRVDGERPLTDARHAAVQTWVVNLLRSTGWIVEPETSFNHFGDRGRVDVLAYHPVVRILLVIEIKSRLDDAQELLGRLDIKRRIAPKIGAERGWPIAAIVPVIVFGENRSTRDGFRPMRRCLRLTTFALARRPRGCDIQLSRSRRESSYSWTSASSK